MDWLCHHYSEKIHHLKERDLNHFINLYFQALRDTDHLKIVMMLEVSILKLLANLHYFVHKKAKLTLEKLNFHIHEMLEVYKKVLGPLKLRYNKNMDFLVRYQKNFTILDTQLISLELFQVEHTHHMLNYRHLN